MTRIPAASRRSGFSLLELVISSAVLVGVFALLTLAMTRIHGLRLDTDRQTRLLTEGRAILDRIEDDLRNAAGTNFVFADSAMYMSEGGEAASSSGLAYKRMEFVRNAAVPRGVEAGGAATNAPFLTVLYDLASTNGARTVLRREATPWRTPEDGVTNAHYATEYTFAFEDGSSYIVTNVVPAFGDTYVNPAYAGDTVTLPVTSGSTRRLAYRDAYILGGWADIVSTESALTNLVTAGVTFSNSFSRVVTNLLLRPPAVSWPELQTNVAALAQAVRFDAASFTNSSALTDVFLDYTNAPFASAVDMRLESSVSVATNEFDAATSTNLSVVVVSTNYPAYILATNVVVAVSTNVLDFAVTTNDVSVVTTNYPAIVISTNVIPVVTTNYPAFTVSTNVVTTVATTNLLARASIAVTNGLSLATTLPALLPAALTNEFGEVTNAVWDTDSPYPVDAFSTNSPPLDGAAALVAYPPPSHVPDYWTYYASSKPAISPASPVAAPSGGTVTNGPIHIDLSGVIAAVTNAPGTLVKTNSLDALAVFYQTSDLFRLQTAPDTPSSLTNLHWRADPIAFTNRFAPIRADGSPIPLDLLQIVTVQEHDFLDASYVSVDTSMAAHGVDCGISPVRSATIDRSVRCKVEEMVLSTNQIGITTSSNLVCVVSLDFDISSTFSLETAVPSSLLATNRYRYADREARDGPRTASDTDTEWREFTLDQDYPGGVESIVGLWLEEKQREGREVKVSERKLYRPVAVAKPEVAATPVAGRDYGSVYNAAFTPFCFRKDEKTGVIDLAVWDPDDEEAEPPVCVDIYLEMLSPAHRRRADALAIDVRDKYIQDHVLRLTRRVALSGHNLFQDPR